MISLKKGEEPLKNIAVGLNWGSIQAFTVEEPGFFGKLFGQKESKKVYHGRSENVDLDGSAVIFNGSKDLETIYFGNLRSKDGAIRHSGDDTHGDANGDDGNDNEVITFDLPNIRPDATSIYIFLNSFRGQTFGSIPYSKIRVFEGDARKVEKMLASFNLSSDPSYNDRVTMIMGKLEKDGSGWKFTAMGDAIKATKISDTISYIKSNLL